jgi:hypothetical protein
MSKRTENLKKNLMDDSYFDFTKNSENKSNISSQVQINDMHYVQNNKNEYNTLTEGIWTSIVRNFFNN